MMYLSYKYHRHIPIQKYLWALNRWQLTWWESCRCCSRNTRGMKAPSKTSLHPYFFFLTPFPSCFCLHKLWTIKEIPTLLNDSCWLLSPNHRNDCVSLVSLNVTDQSYHQDTMHQYWWYINHWWCFHHLHHWCWQPWRDWCKLVPHNTCHWSCVPPKPILPPTTLIYNASFVRVLHSFVSTKFSPILVSQLLVFYEADPFNWVSK